MRLFWGNRNRHGHHANNTHVTTTGTRVIDAHDGHRGHNIITVPATNVSTLPGTHVTTSRDQRRYYSSHRSPSTVHGLLNKIWGALTGNQRRRRHGEREMRRARDERRARRTARQVERARDTGYRNKLRKFRERRRHRHRDRKHHSNDPVVIAQDTGGRHHHSHSDTGTRRAPWMHFGRRTLPPYHGAHHRFLGLFTRGGDRRARGQAMAALADEERRRERRRRREALRDQGRHYRERRRL